MNITSSDYTIVSTDISRINSLTIRMRKLEFLPVADRFLLNLVNYEVAGTAVKTIGEENFNGMIWLERLALPSNRIATVQRDTFQGLVRLKQIDLSKNFSFVNRPFRLLHSGNQIFVYFLTLFVG